MIFYNVSAYIGGIRMTMALANVQNNGKLAGIISTSKTQHSKNEKVFVMEGAEKRIQKAKVNLLTEVKKHFDDLSVETEERFKMLLKRLDERLKDCEVAIRRKKLQQERKNIERQQRFAIKQLNEKCDAYQKLLQSFTIVTSRVVVYNGETFERNEPIRRLTKNHLDFLREINHGMEHSASMQEALQLYKEEIQGFLEYVKHLN